eukprot:9703634-Karenia_brevis.AAC.1
MWVKVEARLGPNVAAGDVLEVVCLNRIFRWVPGSAVPPEAECIELEADARHEQRSYLRSLGRFSTGNKQRCIDQCRCVASICRKTDRTSNMRPKSQQG